MNIFIAIGKETVIGKFAMRAVIWVVLLLMLIRGVLAEETDGSPFALEFPELNSGQIVTPKSYISSSNVNLIKFWVYSPASESIDWSKINVRINRQSANRICSQMVGSQGKVFRCDLNHLVGFKLFPKQSNFFEIEAVGRDGKRYYKSFIVITDSTQAINQGGAKNTTSTLGFSGRRFAVVMGVSKYLYNDVGLGNLSYADADAEAMNKWLVEKGGFNPSDILLLTNENATLGGVRDSLGRFLTKATETDLVLFFFAGHGTPDPFNPSELYYLLSDSKVADLKNTGLPMTELKRIMDTQLKSKRAIFLLDTCHSAGIANKNVVGLRSEDVGAGTRDLGETGFDERQLERVEVKNNVSQAATQLFGLPGRAVLTSSDAGEASREGKLWGGGHGVFTWALLEGLSGKADSNGDRVVTAEELFKFVNMLVRAETNSKQNPHLFSNLANGLEITVLK